jgi:probable HAF family extracellular repeat protein
VAAGYGRGTMNRALFVVGTAAAMAVGASTAASAATTQQGTASVAGVQVGPQSSWVTGLDNRGDVVGAYTAASGTRGYVWRGGVFTDLGVLNGGNYTYTTSVNDGGEVVGYSGDFAASTGVQAFVWRDGTMTELAGLGGNSLASQINDSGLIDGAAATASGQSYAVLWRNGKLTELPGLGGTSSGPVAMNAAGQVAGYSDTAAGDQDAVLWTNGKITDLGPGQVIALSGRGEVLVQVSPVTGPAYVYLWDNGTKIDLPAGVTANDLNDQGQVVGTYTPAGASTQDGFVWQRGTLTDLGTENPVAINDRGQILAVTDDNGLYDTVVLDHGVTITLTPTSGTSATPALISDGGWVAGETEATASATAWQLR